MILYKPSGKFGASVAGSSKIFAFELICFERKKAKNFEEEKPLESLRLLSEVPLIKYLVNN